MIAGVLGPHWWGVLIIVAVFYGVLMIASSGE